MPKFSSEAQLVRLGRRLVRTALVDIDRRVWTRYEVHAPGAVPDLVLFTRRGRRVDYVVAAEFKLRDWRRALRQAFRHRNFVNESYVVLDDSRARPALKHVRLFEQANVGLITVDWEGLVVVRSLPHPALPFSSRFARAFARELIAPHRTLPRDLPFTRSVRGGVALAGLRSNWGTAGLWSRTSAMVSQDSEGRRHPHDHPELA